MESTKTNPTDIQLMETTAYASMNTTNENEKLQCNFCNRCNSCQADFDKDKAKVKNKKDIETRCNVLNYFVFLWVLLLMFISNMAVWLTMSN